MSFKKSILQEIVKLAIPITIGQLGFMLMGFADTVMLGKYSTIEMSAASFGNVVFFQVIIFGMGLLFAVSTLVSISIGEEKPEKSIGIFYSSILLSFLLSIVLYIILYILIENIHWFGQTETIGLLGGQYLYIVNFSTPFIIFFTCSKQLMDGYSKTKVSMYITFIGLSLNILLNWILIFGHFGFEKMGLIGAAWATTIARFVMMVLMISTIFANKDFRFYQTIYIEKKSYLKDLLKLGVPIGFSFFFEIFAFSTGLIMAGWISEIALAAHQIAFNIASLTYMFVTGIAAAASIIVGNYYGSKNKEAIKTTFIQTIKLTLFIEVIFVILLFALYAKIPLIYTKDVEVIALSTGLVILSAFFQVSDGIQAVVGGCLRGIKDTKFIGIISFFSYCIIMIPGAYFLSFYLNLGVKGIWYSFIIGLTFAAIFMVYRFYYKTFKKSIIFEDA